MAKMTKKSKTKNSLEIQLIDRAVFFPETGILVIGDLHLGYENMLKQAGIALSFNERGEIIKRIRPDLLEWHASFR